MNERLKTFLCMIYDNIQEIIFNNSSDELLEVYDRDLWIIGSVYSCYDDIKNVDKINKLRDKIEKIREGEL